MLLQNPWVKDLLSWHGHGAAGVRTPFSSVGGNPLRDDKEAPITIETSLIKKLRALATSIGAGEETQRIIFMVGGPGNGKSEAVQDFLMELDQSTGSEGKLKSLLKREFEPSPLSPWLVKINEDNGKDLPKSFHENVGTLVVVQDASAGTEPGSDAANILAKKLDELIKTSTRPPVFICCTNRGLLSRTLLSARVNYKNEDVSNFIQCIIKATALGNDVLSKDRLDCWPLNTNTKNPHLEGCVACWPLDMESLTITGSGPLNGAIPQNYSPAEQIIKNTVHESRWETDNQCVDCEAASLCPFRTNSAWLRDDETRSNFIKILRRSELALSRRWSFRDLFSLAAELIVGDWNDFKDHEHPCSWVHEHFKIIKDGGLGPGDKLPHSFELVSRLYPNSLFPVRNFSMLENETITVAEKEDFRITLAINDYLKKDTAGKSSYIREFLSDELSHVLDPAMLSLHDDIDEISGLEEGYGQLVSIGNGKWPDSQSMSPVEEVFYTQVSNAEEKEWGPHGREFSRSSEAIRFLRIVASTLAKRSVATRLGVHAHINSLREYESLIQDRNKIEEFSENLKLLFGGKKFRFNALESFGQPQYDKEGCIFLESSPITFDSYQPAPRGTPLVPAHDLPSLEVSRHFIPLTYQLFHAVKIRTDGCITSSLPSSVRASVDLIRHLYAGSISHDSQKFSVGNSSYSLPRIGQVRADADGNPIERPADATSGL